MSEALDPVAMELDRRQLAEQLLAQAKEQGVELVGVSLRRQSRSSSIWRLDGSATVLAD